MKQQGLAHADKATSANWTDATALTEESNGIIIECVEVLHEFFFENII